MTQHEHHHGHASTHRADLSAVTTSPVRRYRGVGVLALASVDADHTLVPAPTRGTLTADDYRTDA